MANAKHGTWDNKDHHNGLEETQFLQGHDLESRGLGLGLAMVVKVSVLILV